MPSLYLDTPENSSISIFGTIREVSRGFAVDDLDGTQPAHGLMHQALQLLPPPGTPHPSDSAALLTRYEVSGNNSTTTSVTGRLVYSTFIGATPSAYVLTRSTRTVTETTQRYQDGKPIFCSYEQGKVPLDVVAMTVRRPMTAIVAEGLRFGSPNYAAADYVGYVSADHWQGRPPGCWLLDEFSTAYSIYQGFHTFRAVALGAIPGRDWSSWGILRNSVTGKYVTFNSMPDFMQATAALPYSVGGIGVSNRGYVRAGLYPQVSFAGIGL